MKDNSPQCFSLSSPSLFYTRGFSLCSLAPNALPPIVTARTKHIIHLLQKSPTINHGSSSSFSSSVSFFPTWTWQDDGIPQAPPVSLAFLAFTFQLSSCGPTTPDLTRLSPHRKVLRDNIKGVTKPAIRRIARRGGVKRISAAIYDEARVALRERLTLVCFFFSLEPIASLASFPRRWLRCANLLG